MRKHKSLAIILFLTFVLLACRPPNLSATSTPLVSGENLRVESTATPLPTLSPTRKPTLESTKTKATPNVVTTTQQPPVFEPQKKSVENQKLIAFTSNRDGNSEIYVMNPDGTKQINLTNSQFEDTSPVWSPDGEVIAFITNRNDPQSQDCASKNNCIFEIFTIKPDGTDLKQITTAIGGKPVWSPDGQYMAFQFIPEDYSEKRAADIYIIKTDGSTLRNLTTHPSWNYNPVWHPDGTKIAFNSTRDEGLGSIYSSLYVVNVDGTNLSLFPDVDGRYAQWSPDGKKLAFTSHRHEVADDLFIANSDFSELQQLTTTPRYEFLLSWSPNGKRLAYVYSCDYECQIRLINLTANQDFLLTQVPSGWIYSLIWTLDSTQIIFSTGEEEQQEIYAITLDDPEIRNLSGSPNSNDYQPSVQP